MLKLIKKQSWKSNLCYSGWKHSSPRYTKVKSSGPDSVKLTGNEFVSSRAAHFYNARTLVQKFLWKKNKAQTMFSVQHRCNQRSLNYCMPLELTDTCIPCAFWFMSRCTVHSISSKLFESHPCFIFVLESSCQSHSA